MSKEILLTALDISKEFGLTKALKDVTISIARGDIMGLIGENGSGKSTFSSIISGANKATSGTLELKGAPYEPQSALDAQDRGISMIVQEIGTIPGIKVADNIFLGKESSFSKGGIINRKQMYEKARQEMAKIGITDIDPAAPITQYSLEDRKLIEVVRALCCNPDIFIIDETTTALSQRGRSIIYDLIKRFQKENKAVIFISHDLEELMEVCNILTILRDGSYITTIPKEEFEAERIKELMVGRRLTGDYYRKDYDGSYGDEVVLRAENIHVKGALHGVSLELHRGEILGIGGLTECGMHELGSVLFGMTKPLYGEVMHKDGDRIASAKTAIRNKIAYVSKNRDQEALILSASIMDNTTLPSMNMISKKGFIRSRDEKSFTQKQVEVLSIKCRTILQDVGDLSGGNKQKVVFGKWLGNESEIFILDCPTRGVDIGVKAAMYQLMYRLKKQGKAIIMISEELTELIGMSDQIMILKDGKYKKTFKRSEDLTESQIVHEMV